MILAIEATSNAGRHVVSEPPDTSAAIRTLIHPDSTGLPDGVVSDELVDNLLWYIPHLSHISKSLHFGLAFNTTRRRIENTGTADIRRNGGP